MRTTIFLIIVVVVRTLNTKINQIVFADYHLNMVKTTSKVSYMKRTVIFDQTEMPILYNAL